jgi:hypothetical protein
MPASQRYFKNDTAAMTVDGALIGNAFASLLSGIKINYS